jgi:hypothetical protein
VRSEESLGLSIQSRDQGAISGVKRGSSRRRRRRWLFAALGLILEILVVEEVLFSRCEYEIRVAIHAFEYAVLKLRHGLFPVDDLSRIYSLQAGQLGPRLKRYPGFWFAIRLPGATSSGYVCGPRPA